MYAIRSYYGRSRNVPVFLLSVLVGLAAIPATAQVSPSEYGVLTYRHIGPAGNRVSAVSGVTGDPLSYYAGAASGGLFKTTDGGVHWAPIFDDQPVASIGAIAVAPSDPNVVWVGTGEPFIRSHISVGWGMFKSTRITSYNVCYTKLLRAGSCRCHAASAERIAMEQAVLQL